MAPPLTKGGMSIAFAHLFGEAVHSEFLIRCLLTIRSMPQSPNKAAASGGHLMIYSACYFWFKSDSSLAMTPRQGVAWTEPGQCFSGYTVPKRQPVGA